MAYCLVRKLSTASGVKQTVQVPVQVFGLEGRYASALYTASVKLKQLDAVEKDVTNLQKILKTDKKFVDFLKNPIMNSTDKNTVLLKALVKLKISEPIKKLLEVMGRNGQLKRTEGVFNALETILDGHKGLVKCIITSARPLDNATDKELISVLQLFVEKNQKIVIEKKIDESLIGGFTVSIGDKFADMSVARKIKNYRLLLEKAL